MKGERFDVVPIGWVESPLVELAQAPRQGTEGAPDALLVFRPEMAEALSDFRLGDEMIVITWLDQARRDVLRTHPRDDKSRVPLGVFSTRSPDRPNPLGLHRIRIIGVDGLRVKVSNLEAINGTPILDVKPVLDPLTER